MKNTTAIVPQARKRTGIEQAADRVVDVDIMPLLDARAVKNVTDRSKKLDLINEAVETQRRDVARLEQEIADLVSEKQAKLKAEKKALRGLNKLAEINSMALYQCKMDALCDVPGDSLDEKKRFLVNQSRRELAK